MGRPGNSATGEGANTKKAIKGVQGSSGKVIKKSNSAQARGQSQSCHQCRQSIHSSKGVSEVKQGKARLKCSTCTRFWCEQCLLNRYGVVKDEADPVTWSCPVCEKKCNCSLCRKKEGKLATGILTPLVKNSGFESVSEFLDKGTTDIAKVLQWKSPAGPVEERPKGDTQRLSPDSTKPKRKRRSSSSKGGRSKENSSSFHSSKSEPFTKRRRLTHSQYSITLEDNLGTQAVSSDTVASEPPVITAPPSISNHSKCVISSPDQSSMTSPDSATVHIPCRRSSRQRKQSKFFMAEDFRKDSPENSPVKKEKIVCFQSPIASFKSPDVVPTKSEYEPTDELLTEKAQILEDLRSEQFEVIKQKKSDYEQKIKEEKDKACKEKLAQRKVFLEEKAKAKEAKTEERKKALKEKVRLREELKLSRIRAREKMRLAQSVKRQAMKEMKRVQREKERVRKQELLAELKERNRTEKRRKLELVTTRDLNSHERNEVGVSLVEDSPEDCLVAGVPTLPPLPPLTLPSTPSHLHSSLLFVAEFLTVFAQPLNLKKRVGVGELCSALISGRGLSEVYLKLLMVLIDEGSWTSSKLKSSKKQRDLEQAARCYLSENNINGVAWREGPPSVEESLCVLDHLCHQALCSSTITEHLDTTREYLEQMKREQRVKEREAVKRVGDSLKSLCEGGGTLGEIQQRKEEFAKELKQTREEFQKELAGYSDSIRNSFLGEDRHSRKYWRLKSFPGIVVETAESASRDENFKPGPWAIVDNRLLLDKLMSGLHPAGLREKPLHDALKSLKSTIFQLSH